MIFHEQPSADWIPFDFKLLEAYQILQDETCPKCGHPIWLCRSDSNNIGFKVRTAVCYADRELKMYEDSKKPMGERAKSKERAQMGEYYYVYPYNPPTASGPLPTRQQFYEEMSAKAGSTVE